MRYSRLTGGSRLWPTRDRPAREAPDRAASALAPPPLVAVAHGSADPRAAAAITQLMGVVRARARRAGLGNLPVRAAYLGHALPSVPDVLEALCESEPAHITDAARPGSCRRTGRPPGAAPGPRPVVVLPLLLAEAYHSDTDLPAVLREAARCLPRLRISYGAPLGPHPALLSALERRLALAGAPASALAGAPAGAAVADTAVVLAAAGSSRPAANAAVARLAAAWQSARGWRAVVPAYASAASPAPGEAVARLLGAGVPRVAVASYLLAPGVFADRVREASLAAGAGLVSPALGAAPEVADVIIERYLQAARATAEPSLATATRGQALLDRLPGDP
jgi:sirohydrochlorin ferrochelatase